MPILVITGLSDPDDKNTPIVVNSAKVLKFIGKDVKVGFTEYHGRGAEVGQKEMEILEDQTEVLGLQPNVRETVAATATSQRWRKGHNADAGVAPALRQRAGQGNQFSAAWMDEELSEDFRVDIFSDFATDPGSAMRLDVLLKARVASEIPRRVFLTELKRRTTLSEDLDTDEVDRELQKEERDREERMVNRDPLPGPALDGDVTEDGA